MTEDGVPDPEGDSIMPEAGRSGRSRFGWPSALAFSGTTWLCVGSLLLGVWSLGHSSIAERRRERAAAWLRSAGADVRVEETPYWGPPVGGLRSLRSYHVRFPPSKTLTPYEIESLFALPGLRELNLASNPVDDALAIRLARIRTLERLDLSRTQVTDVGLRAVAALPALQHLSIGATPTTAEAIREVGRRNGWSGFHEDWLRWKFWQETGEAAGVSDRKLEITPKTKLSPAVAHRLREMTGLEEIVVLHRTPPITRDNWQALGEATAVRRLDIRSGIDRSGVAGLGAFRSLEELTLKAPDLDDSLLGTLPLGQLRTLNIELASYDASGLASLKGAPHLERFSLTGPVLTGNDTRASRWIWEANEASIRLQAYRQGPRYEALESLPKLRVLVLDRVAIDARAIRHLSRIPGLQELTLRSVAVADEEGVEALKLLRPHPTLKRITLPRFLPESKLVDLVRALRSGPVPKELTVSTRNAGIQRTLRTIPGIRIQN